MDKKEIKKITKDSLRTNTETSLVEFKDGRGGLPRSVWKSITSFAHNPGGGIIVFGIDENDGDFEIVGNDNISSLQEQFSDLMNNEMSFVLRPSYNVLEIDGEDIFAVYIPECPTQFKPFYYKSVGLPNGAYIRDGNTDRRMTDREMRKFIENAKKYKFDMKRAKGTTLKELSKEKILKLLLESGERIKRDISLGDINFDLMKNLGISDNFEGTKMPTVAGFLIFSKNDPQNKKFFSRFLIRCVRYKG